MSGWDEVDPALARLEKSAKTFDGGRYRECENCAHRHRRGDRCRYPDGGPFSPGCQCRK